MPMGILKLPAVVGVPLMTPVLKLNDKSGGSPVRQKLVALFEAVTLALPKPPGSSVLLAAVCEDRGQKP